MKKTHKEKLAMLERQFQSGPPTADSVHLGLRESGFYKLDRVNFGEYVRNGDPVALTEPRAPESPPGPKPVHRLLVREGLKDPTGEIRLTAAYPKFQGPIVGAFKSLFVIDRILLPKRVDGESIKIRFITTEPADIVFVQGRLPAPTSSPDEQNTGPDLTVIVQHDATGIDLKILGLNSDQLPLSIANHSRGEVLIVGTGLEHGWDAVVDYLGYLGANSLSLPLFNASVAEVKDGPGPILIFGLKQDERASFGANIWPDSLIASDPGGMYSFGCTTRRQSKPPALVVFQIDDPFGFFPPVNRITADDAAFLFLTGLIGIKGDPDSVNPPAPVFQPCWNGPIHYDSPWTVTRLFERTVSTLEESRFWLINTAVLNAESQDDATKRQRIFEIITSIATGKLDRSLFRRHPLVGYEVPLFWEGLGIVDTDPSIRWPKKPSEAAAKVIGAIGTHYAATHQAAATPSPVVAFVGLSQPNRPPKKSGKAKTAKKTRTKIPA